MDQYCLKSGLPRCVNCRRAVEASMSRIAGRNLRKVRVLEECSAARCLEFLRGVKEEAMRLHLASMAWWRFSTDDAGAAEPILGLIRDARAEIPESGAAYMHRALRVLSPLTSTQLAVWFGCENLYQLATVFMGDRPPSVGRHCSKCGLYKQGCTAYSTLGANDCRLWRDAFVQNVAAAVSHAGRWKNPCSGIDNGSPGPART